VATKSDRLGMAGCWVMLGRLLLALAMLSGMWVVVVVVGPACVVH